MTAEEEPIAHKAWKAMRELEPKLPELRSWMAAMQVAAAAATPENEADWLSTWRDVYSNLEKLIAVAHLLAGIIAPGGVLHWAYAEGAARMQPMDTRLQQLTAYLSYVALVAQGTCTPEESQQVKQGYGDAKYTIEELTTIVTRYHDAIEAVFGTPAPPAEAEGEQHA